MALVTAKELTLGYSGKIVARNVSFEISRGDYLCIIGENGSGKSTLIKTLLGLTKPLGGKLAFADGLKKKQIGYLPQQTTLQRDFPASVYEVVLSGCANKHIILPFYTKEDYRLVEKNMRRLNIYNLRRTSFRELSGGQQQRVLLARALCAAENVVLLDEPVSGLDPIATSDFYKMIDEINADGVTVIMVSHDTASVAKSATHVLHMHETPLFFGTLADYRASDVGRAFLGGERND